MGDQGRFAVRPRVLFNEVSVETDSTFYYRYEIINKGIGPAIIDSVSILYQGKARQARFDQFFRSTFPETDGISFLNFETTYLSPGSILSEGETQTLFSWRLTKAAWEDLLKILPATDPASIFEVVVRYSSMYEEQWRIRSHAPTLIPEPL